METPNPLFINNEIYSNFSATDHALYNFCRVDAVFNLLAAELECLDPVILDAGCQWRVPFILDLYAAVKSKLSELDDVDVAKALRDYRNLRRETVVLRNFLKEDDATRRHISGAAQTGDYTITPGAPEKNDNQVTCQFTVAYKNEDWGGFQKVFDRELGKTTKYFCLASAIADDLIERVEKIITELSRELENINAAESRKARTQYNAKKVDIDRYTELKGAIQERSLVNNGENFVIIIPNNNVNYLKSLVNNLLSQGRDKFVQDVANFFEKLTNTVPDFIQIYELVQEVSKEFTGDNEIFSGTRKNARFEGNEIKKFITFDYLTLCKLFTVNRVRRMDKFQISGVRHDLAMPFSKEGLVAMSRALARYSRTYMTHVMEIVAEKDRAQKGDQDGLLLNEVTLSLVRNYQTRTQLNNVKFKTHVFYAPLQGIFSYQQVKRQPIILDLRRMNCVPRNEILQLGNVQIPDHTYTLNGAKVLYFAPNAQGGFDYKADPTEEERKTVGMCVEIFSINDPNLVRNVNGVPAELDSNDFDTYINALVKIPVVDLIMWGGSSHDETPAPLYDLKQVQEEEKENEGSRKKQLVLIPNNQILNNIEARYEKAHGLAAGNPITWNLTNNHINLFQETTEHHHHWRQRASFQMLLTACGITDVSYKHYTRDRKSGYRTNQPIIFAPIHIYGATFETKQRDVVALLQNHRDNNYALTSLMSPEDEHDQLDLAHYG